jgi:TetR/AcrR family transcriptional regulator, cholesterol catabolism regulator
MKELQRRRIGRPPLTGPEAEANPLNALSPEERRTLFLKTAARLFEEKGYSNTSVEDITRELGFTKGVFYYYWKNKREIVQEIHDRALETINAGLDGVMAEESSAAVRLEAAIRNHVGAVLENRSIIAVLLGDFAFSEETLEGRRAYGRRFQALVEEGIAAGVVRDLDPTVLTYAILGLCNSVARWYRPEGRLSAEEVRDLFAAFAAEGWHADRSGDALEATSGDRDRSDY